MQGCPENTVKGEAPQVLQESIICGDGLEIGAPQALQTTLHGLSNFTFAGLKPLIAVIERIEESIETYITDAYCYLSADREHGPEMYLHTAVDPGKSVSVCLQRESLQACLQPVVELWSICFS